MKQKFFKNAGALSIFLVTAMSLAMITPLLCDADEYPLTVDFSPKIINIASQRMGEIRVFTNTSYSNFIANGDSMLIFFNGGVDSVPNIQATSDSAGHLILRFMLDDLLVVESDLFTDEYNTADVVLVMSNGDEYIGLDDEVYIVDKLAP